MYFYHHHFEDILVVFVHLIVVVAVHHVHIVLVVHFHVVRVVYEVDDDEDGEDDVENDVGVDDEDVGEDDVENGGDVVDDGMDIDLLMILFLKEILEQMNLE